MVHQADVRLVNQGGRLERVAGTLAPKPGYGEAMKLPVNHRSEFVESFLAAALPAV
jgi:hypothetical protein